MNKAESNESPTEEDIQQFIRITSKVDAEIKKVIVGQGIAIREILIALFSGGHILLEGVPGLGKSLLVRTLGTVFQASFSRIQFTPDLMPADITGTNIVSEDSKGHRSFKFHNGPIFSNIVLADEINRATPKTQSALLEGMQERTVSVGNETLTLPAPFFVMATQNPIEMEGTYPLPEAQLDRFFFKVNIPFPERQDMRSILDRTIRYDLPQVDVISDGTIISEMIKLARNVPVMSYLKDFAVDLIMATHPSTENASQEIKRYVKYGASPRGLQALIIGAQVRGLMEGRYNASEDDIRAVVSPALRHRIALNFEADIDNVTVDQIIENLLDSVQPIQS